MRTQQLIWPCFASQTINLIIFLSFELYYIFSIQIWRPFFLSPFSIFWRQLTRLRGEEEEEEEKEGKENKKKKGRRIKRKLVCWVKKQQERIEINKKENEKRPPEIHSVVKVGRFLFFVALPWVRMSRGGTTPYERLLKQQCQKRRNAQQTGQSVSQNELKSKIKCAPNLNHEFNVL